MSHTYYPTNVFSIKLSAETSIATNSTVAIVNRKATTVVGTIIGILDMSVTLLTYFLAPRSRVLLAKLTVLQLLKKFPTFYGTRKFITAFTSARHLSLS
jgi:hypothetical protein